MRRQGQDQAAHGAQCCSAQCISGQTKQQPTPNLLSSASKTKPTHTQRSVLQPIQHLVPTATQPNQHPVLLSAFPALCTKPFCTLDHVAQDVFRFLVTFALQLSSLIFALAEQQITREVRSRLRLKLNNTFPTNCVSNFCDSRCKTDHLIFYLCTFEALTLEL